MMLLDMKNPALGARGISKADQLGGVICSEDTLPIRSLQVSSLTRRCAISAALAEAVAPLLYGEGR